MSKGVTDYERALVKLRAFEMLAGWVTMTKPVTGTMDDLINRREWTFEERMAKADEMAAWALSPCKGEEEAT